MLPTRLKGLLRHCDGHVEWDCNGIDRPLLDFTLSLTPTERLESMDGSLHFAHLWSDAMRRLIGYDPAVSGE